MLGQTSEGQIETYPGKVCGGEHSVTERTVISRARVIIVCLQNGTWSMWMDPSSQ